MKYRLLSGLVAATHTPFHACGSLNLDAVAWQSEHLLKNRITSVFIGGSTGESHSLSLAERHSLSQRWSEVARNTELRLVIHVGSNSLSDAKSLAAQAQQLGARAISALAPSYFKPRTLDLLIDCMAEIAGAAPQTPFYFYDIPVLTNVHSSMPEFLAKASARIPSLAGIKFTNSDLMALQLCLRAEDGKWDIPFGCDEYLLAALAIGARGAVGSSYNFAAPIYHRIVSAFERGDLATAREEQYRSVQLIQLLARFGYLGAAKAVMEMLGVPVGPPRLPNAALSSDQASELRKSLEVMGFFDWIAESTSGNDPTPGIGP